MIPVAEGGTETTPKSNWKVGKNIETYGLDEMDEELVARWIGEEDEQSSLRELADYFNREVLKAALAAAGAHVRDEEVAYTYRMLTDKSVTSGMQTETIRSLESKGVEYDEVESDFVTHQAIYTYLSDYHDAEYASSDVDPVEKSTETINQLKSRSNAVIESTIDRLDNADRVSIGDEEIIVSFKIVCRECMRSYDIIELLEQGHCECDEAVRTTDQAD